MEYGMERILPPCGTNRNKKINIMDTNKKKWTREMDKQTLERAAWNGIAGKHVDFMRGR